MIRRVVALIGTAIPSPIPATAVLIPTTSALALASAPPELPGLSAASVWMTSSITRTARPERTGRRRGLRIIDVVAGGPADRSGLKSGDLVLEAGRRPVADAQSLQRLLFADAINRPLPMTVYRRGAMVDVISVPTELTGG